MDPSEWFTGVIDDFSDLPDIAETLRMIVRLLFAAILGGLIGYERQDAGKAAGLRTHMLVACGAALFLIISDRLGMSPADSSRVIQGIVTGIGFLGGGTILKLADEQRIKGLTTAASIWMTAAIGVAAGAGKLTTAIIAACLAYLILRFIYQFEQRYLKPKSKA